MVDQKVQIVTSLDGQAQLKVAVEHDTDWLNQSQMAVLLDTSIDNVGLHLKNIFSEKNPDDPAD